MLVVCAVTAMSQHKKPKPVAAKSVVAKSISFQLADFYHKTNEAGIVFNFPVGFRELPVVNNDDFSYDYAMEIPDQDFEIWFLVKSQKTNWADYERYKNDPAKRIGHPDSLYIQIGHAEASGLMGDQPYFTRNISRDVLKRYNADGGKSYLLDLEYMKVTKHYKYALLLTLQKNHIGTILAVCFTNEKSPEFFKNVNRMSRYIKFKS
jgi:hypothetical protein